MALVGKCSLHGGFLFPAFVSLLFGQLFFLVKENVLRDKEFGVTGSIISSIFSPLGFYLILVIFLDRHHEKDKNTTKQ